MRSGRKGSVYPLQSEIRENEIELSYFVNSSNQVIENCGIRRFAYTLPRYISRTKRTFEVIGLLQAEMGKTNNNLVFANNEPSIINETMEWFKDELIIPFDRWKWSVKLNLVKPLNEQFKDELENNLIDFWCMNSHVQFDAKYLTGVTYISNTKNTIANNNGTVGIEISSILLAQFMQSLLLKFQSMLLECSAEEKSAYMRGIIAAEGCVEHNRKIGKRTVHISASKEEERLLFKACLASLGIDLKVYNNYNETIISQRLNLRNVEKLDLMSLNPTKYAKFIEMMSCYKGADPPKYRHYCPQTFINESVSH